MKRIFLFFAVCAFIACNNEKGTEATDSAAAIAQVPANTYGFTPGYSFSFVMDSAKNTETVLSLWRDWENGDLSKSRSHFADSLTMISADGSIQSGLSDSVLAGAQGYRSSFSKMAVTIDAIFGVRSTDKNEDWVAVWGSEIQTAMDGKVDTVSLQETWRFNKAGKIDLMFQTARKGGGPPPPTN